MERKAAFRWTVPANHGKRSGRKALRTSFLPCSQLFSVQEYTISNSTHVLRTDNALPRER